MDIDGGPFGSVIREGMKKPLMFLISRSRQRGPDYSSPGPETGQVKADIQSIYDRVLQDKRQWVFIRGANHFLYSDDGAVLASNVVRRALRLFRILQIDGRRQLAVATYCVHSFFDAYLKQTSAPPLKITSPLCPELDVVDDAHGTK